MMARLRVPAETKSTVVADQVPAELLDHQAAVWASPTAYETWCQDNLGHPLAFIPLADRSAYHRFTAGAERWAALHGLVLAGERGFADWGRLAELGIARPRRRLIIRRGA
jgi:hypothetical protein